MNKQQTNMLAFYRKLNIQYKISILLIGLSLLVISLVSVVLAVQFRNALEERILLQLSSIRHLKTAQLEHVFNSHVHEIEMIARNLDNNSYLDALAEDQFIHIDSVVSTNIQAADDSIAVLDISPQFKDGKIHLEYSYPLGGYVYKFYSSSQQIQQILFERTGMGESGETYLVGSDYYLRTISRFYPEEIPTQIYSKTKAAEYALNNTSGGLLHLDYRQVEVFSSYGLLQFKGVKWAVLSEIDKQEAFSPIREMADRILFFAIIMFMISSVISYYIAHRLVSPIIKARDIIKDISRGEKAKPLEWSSQDEMGDMFYAINELVKVNDQIIYFSNQIAEGTGVDEMQPRGEADLLVAALNNMKKQLKQLKQKEQQLLNKNHRLFVEGEEKERARLSRELHDSIAPLLTSILHKLQHHYNDSNKEHEVILIVRDTIQELRKVSFNLMPSVLKDFGLIEALHSFVKVNFEDRGTKIFIEHTKEGEGEISKEVELNLFRIIQEAIHNAIKHAHAHEIRLSVTEFADQINVYISDDGKGFDVDNVPKGSGLQNMKERVRIFNGHWFIQSGAEGTSIEIEFNKQSND
ncbi:HAMP domain-containing sensor histidine kinase [Labilibacter marinus]|uniref:HAMP domain-containing sensor histidine kinase n=1 Tax=Labilibacter marinus TaxID=1477105 RepID=UPI000833C030|nr:ATP-binding protein [Labilibacter marinus]